MKVDVLEAILASAYLYSVGYSLFFVNKKVIKWVFDDVFGRFQRKGADAYRRAAEVEKETKAYIRRMEEVQEELEKMEAMMAVSSEGQNLFSEKMPEPDPTPAPPPQPKHLGMMD